MKKEQFVVIGADVSLVIYGVENGELIGKERQTAPLRIKRSEWKDIKSILNSKLNDLCEKEKLEELNISLKDKGEKGKI